MHQHIEPKYLPGIYGGVRPEYGYADWFRSLTRDQNVVKGINRHNNVITRHSTNSLIEQFLLLAIVCLS